MIGDIKSEIYYHMPLLTYGTTLNGAYNKFLKLTNSIKSDLLNGRMNAQSLNQGKNSITQAIYYIPTVRQRSISYHTLKGRIGSFYSSAYLNHHILQCPCILIWIWDNRFVKLLKKKQLGSVPISLHFAEKHNIKDIKLEYGSYNPNDAEVVIKNKDLRPEPDFVVLGSDCHKISYLEFIKEVFFPDNKNTILIDWHTKLLNSPKDDSEKYISINQSIELGIRKRLFQLIINNPIPNDWKGWVNKIKYFLSYEKLNVRI